MRATDGTPAKGKVLHLDEQARKDLETIRAYYSGGRSKVSESEATRRLYREKAAAIEEEAKHGQ